MQAILSVNDDQRLFIIPAGKGYITTMGFDYVYQQSLQVRQKLLALKNKLSAEHLNKIHGIEIKAEEVGTLTQYAQYQELFAIASKFDLGTWYSHDTPKEVQRILNKYMNSSDKIRIFYGDVKTGRDWLEECDTVGTVGRSTGVMKIPLLMKEDDNYGASILDACIVRIIDVETSTELYRHEKYQLPDLELRRYSEGDLFDKGYTYGVFMHDENQANFKSLGKAAKYISFMLGECHCQP